MKSASKLIFFSTMLWLLLSLSGCVVSPSSIEEQTVPAIPVELDQIFEPLSQLADLASERQELITTSGVSSVAAVSVESNTTQMDLWQRIRAGYQLNLENYPTSVLEQRDWYIKHPRYISTVVKRAKPFIHYVTEQLSDSGLPLELVLLPII